MSPKQPKGSKDPNNRVLGPNYNKYYSIWALTPYHLGPRTLRAKERCQTQKGTALHGPGIAFITPVCNTSRSVLWKMQAGSMQGSQLFTKGPNTKKTRLLVPKTLQIIVFGAQSLLFRYLDRLDWPIGCHVAGPKHSTVGASRI